MYAKQFESRTGNVFLARLFCFQSMIVRVLYATIFLCSVDFRKPSEKIFSVHRPMLRCLLPKKGKYNSEV